MNESSGMPPNTSPETIEFERVREFSAKVTTEQMAAYVQKTGKSHTCPHCEDAERNWTVLNEEQSWVGAMSLPKSGTVPLPPHFVPSVVVACSNCGYVKTFSLFVMAMRILEGKNG